MNFVSEFKLDYKAYCWLCNHADSKGLARIGLCSLLYLVGLMVLRNLGYLIYSGAIAAGYLIICAVSLSRRRKEYRKTLERNNGNQPHLVTIADGAGVRCRNLNTGKEFALTNEEITQVICGTRFIHAGNADRSMLLSFKTDCMTEGDAEALKKHLSTEGRTIVTLRSVRWINRLTVIVSVLYLLAALFFGAMFASVTELPNMDVPPMDVRTAAALLEELGIEGITEDMILEIEDSPYQAVNAVPSLLSYVGWGDYDDETWEWTPSRNGVYAIDMEVFEISEMYSNVLTGIAALSDGELVFTDVTEGGGLYSMELGVGWKKVRFTFDGRSRTLRPFTVLDWLNTDFLNDVAKLVERSDTGKELYFLYDADTVFYVFYRDAAWAAEFEAATGYELRQRMG